MAELSKDALATCQHQLERALDAALELFRSTDREALVVEKKDSSESLASQVFTELDQNIEEAIRAELQPCMDQFGLGWLGEESSTSDASETSETHDRFQKPAFWCVDPLDGTLAFLEGDTGYATAIALVDQSGKAIMGGIMHPPSEQRWLSWQEDTLTAPTDGVKETLTFFTDGGFFEMPTFAPFMLQVNQLARDLGYQALQLVSDQGAVMNAIGVLHTPHSFYLKLPKSSQGGGALWDFAASVAMFQSAGRPQSDCRGQPINLNSEQSLFLNHCGVCFAHDQRLHTALLTLVAERTEDGK